MVNAKLVMTPGPTNVPERVLRAMTRPMISHRGPDFHALYGEIEENLKYVFQTRNDVFILTSSGTGGVECAVSNLISPGEKVIVPVFGVFSERLSQKVKLRGGITEEVRLPWGAAPTASDVENAVEDAPDAKAILIVYNETSTGVTVRELHEIGKTAQRNNLLLMVDAVSILGGDKLPVDEWNVDICVTGSQKCLACPPGLAMISVSQKAWEKIEKTGSRPMYFDLMRMREIGAKNETPFTPALPLFYALNEALTMVREEGLEKRIQRHKRCAEAFYDALTAYGLTIFPKVRETRSNTVIAFNAPEGVSVEAVKDVMQDRFNVLIDGGMGRLRDKIFRIGCMGVISPVEVFTTLTALGNTLKEFGCALTVEKGLEAAAKALK